MMNLFLLLQVVLLLQLFSATTAKKIAIIGGGISGSFVANYLVEYDPGCTLESITVFEPQFVNRTIQPNDDNNNNNNNEWEEGQGSRVATLELPSGQKVELGASILFQNFHLVSEMIRKVGRLEICPPFHTSIEDDNLRKGLGIYEGNGTWSLRTSNGGPKILNKLQMAWRYNTDLVTMTRISQQMLNKFRMVPSLLSSLASETFFDSPEDIWTSIGLVQSVHASFDALLDVLKLSSMVPWWKRLLPQQGSLRSELLTAANLANYNQDNAHVNGIIGMGSFAAASGGLFSIRGGNYQIIQTTLEHAMQQRRVTCQSDTVIQREKRITTVVGGIDGLTLFAGEENLGEFDIVVLATAMQQSNIQFLVPSHFDGAVLQPMPLAGLINAHDTANLDDTHEGHQVLPEQVPPSALRPYTQVVTTVVSNAVLNADFFNIQESKLPRSVLMSNRGKASTFNISSISQVASTGLFKLFSNDEIPNATLHTLFGPKVKQEYVKVWGGPRGGATPDYQGDGTTTNFLLYDGATGFSGHTSSGALYYPIAMEQSGLASMEIAAVGAKAVAKLIARRLGLIEAPETQDARDEL